ncbi:MAG: putative Transglycosylase [Actinomycetia bacterium]|nr:putative Transglycosylase [Actinomycetes bacterium]
MARGAAGEGGPGDPRAVRMSYDPQTAPLPYGTTSGDPYRNYPDDNPCPDDDPDPDHGDYGDYRDYPDDDAYLPGRPYRRRRRWQVLRWLLGFALALVMLAVIAFGVLFALTPSVSNAPALARAIDKAHHAAYPGPPMSALFAESLVATEDHRFYSEPGVDIYAIARVAASQLTGRGDQGGATLYQQLAKMLYTPGQGGFGVEVKQVMLGIKLDLTYSRATVLRMYADVAYFGHGYYGLAQASCGYFGTTPAGLTLPEAATLAGLVQGPSADDPIAHYARGRAREAHVLGRLVATGKITQAQSTAAYAQRLPLVGRSGTGCTGPR